MEDWIAPNPKLKLVRHNQREGLIRARITGAAAATGDVLVFLDSHCEANIGWLEPLLERIKVCEMCVCGGGGRFQFNFNPFVPQINSSNVVCPVIDVISWEKLEYSTIRGPPGVRGGFNWGLQFKWKKIPEYEQERREHDETR